MRSVGDAGTDVAGAVSAYARRHPEAVALAGPLGELAYGALVRAASAASRRLDEAGVGRGGSVAVAMAPGPERIAVVLAVLGSGARLCWLDPAAGGTRLRSALVTLAADVIVLDASTVTSPDLASGGAVPVVVGTGPGGLLDEPEHPAWPATVAPEDDAYVAFTSGSTGHPRGVPQTHAALAEYAAWMGHEFSLGPGARVGQWVAPDHDPALCEVAAALVTGSTLVLLPSGRRALPEGLVSWLDRERVTHLQTVPSVAREIGGVLGRVGGSPGRPLGALRCLLLMGEALPAAVVEGLRAVAPHVAIANVYGPTETVAATWHRVGDATDPVPIGRPIPGRRVLVVDEGGRECPAGVTGRIVVVGRCVTRGYLTDPDGPGPDDAFARLPAAGGERTYRTGDLGRWRADGLLEFGGRADRQVKVGGVRVEPAAIERCLRTAPNVAEVVVVAPSGPDGLVGRLVAHVAPHPGGPAPSRAGLRRHLRAALASALVPIEFVSWAHGLPRTTRDKVDHGRLRTTHRPPRTTENTDHRRSGAADVTVHPSPVVLDGQTLDIDGVRRIARESAVVAISPDAIDGAAKSRAMFEEIARQDIPIYGVTTGYGEMIYMLVDTSREVELQTNLVRSHSAGVGPLFDEQEARAIVTARLNALARGYSAVRPEVLRRLELYLNEGIIPAIPEIGSLGASGDLAPLSHVASTVIGEGYVLAPGGGTVRTAEVLRERGIEPLELRFKEGLALINGTSAMTGLGSLVVQRALDQVRQAEIVSALVVETIKGSTSPFLSEGHDIARPHAGQIDSAATMRALLHGSALTVDHAVLRGEVQDNRSREHSVARTNTYLQKAYSMRAIPQILGAVRDTLSDAERRLVIELNSSNDNPLFFPGEEVFHGANFHGQPIAFAMDYVTIALTQLGVLSERQTNRLLNRHLSYGLPEFLIKGDPGLTSGFAGAQYPATALVAENRTIAPASTQSVPSNGDNQDVVSMGLIAARNARRVLSNNERILAVEYLAAAQAVDVSGRRDGLSPAGAACYEAVRERVATLEADRFMSDDIETVATAVREGVFLDAVRAVPVDVR